MNKTELVTQLATATGTTKTQSLEFLNAFTNTVSSTMKKDDVRLVGFGTFTAVERKARKGRNPQTGETIQIEAKTVPVFRPGKTLKDTVQ